MAAVQVEQRQLMLQRWTYSIDAIRNIDVGLELKRTTKGEMQTRHLWGGGSLETRVGFFLSSDLVPVHKVFCFITS